ncbi:dihydrodipicolinate synthase family protein, partial [Cetobacterium sp.]|uniref:dihydrodipicolinate synthase family protein n=1 Tax=Cetobacterium sp. TaxID=2071632 RepID=UPI003AF1E233
MKKAKFLAPVITAFNKDREIDIEGNKQVWEHLINGGVNGIVLFGSTGEFYNISMTQKKKLIKLAIEYIDKRISLFVGTGSMNMQETIELSNYALDSGADGVMIIGPYYFPINDRDLESFYSKLAKNINGNIYLYNFPKMTGHDINPNVLLNLLDKHSNIVGYKDTVSEMSHTRNLIQAIKDKYPNFIVYSGYDDNFVHNIISGGDGCIGALSNIYPQVFKQWVDAIDNKDIVKIEEFQKLTDSLMEIYDLETPFIPVLKRALILNGIKIEEYCTEPFGIVSEVKVIKLKKIL